MVPALAKALALAHGSRTPASFVRQRFPCRPADGVPVILMLPGINNDAAFPYVQHVMRLVLAEGLGTPAAVNWRGLGGLPLSAAGGATPKVYCGLGAPDLAEILSHLRRRLPSSPLYAVGWSMGGCILVRHMAEAGEGCELRAAMAVSPALDVSAVQRYWQGAHSGSGGAGPAVSWRVSSQRRGCEQARRSGACTASRSASSCGCTFFPTAGN